MCANFFFASRDASLANWRILLLDVLDEHLLDLPELASYGRVMLNSRPILLTWEVTFLLATLDTFFQNCLLSLLSQLLAQASAFSLQLFLVLMQLSSVGFMSISGSITIVAGGACKPAHADCMNPVWRTTNRISKLPAQMPNSVQLQNLRKAYWLL